MTAPATDKASKAGSSAFVPPKSAQKLELAEFAKWEKNGDTVFGLVTGYMEREDKEHPGKMMKSFILSPAAFAPGGDMAKGAVYHSLSLGLGAHLGLLFPTPQRTADAGSCVIVRLAGSRPAVKRGQNPSHQFDVYTISKAELRDYLITLAGPDGLPFEF